MVTGIKLLSSSAGDFARIVLLVVSINMVCAIDYAETLTNAYIMAARVGHNIVAEAGNNAQKTLDC